MIILPTVLKYNRNGRQWTIHLTNSRYIKYQCDRRASFAYLRLVMDNIVTVAITQFLHVLLIVQASFPPLEYSMPCKPQAYQRTELIPLEGSPGPPFPYCVSSALSSSLFLLLLISFPWNICLFLDIWALYFYPSAISPLCLRCVEAIMAVVCRHTTKIIGQRCFHRDMTLTVYSQIQSVHNQRSYSISNAPINVD